MCFAGNQSLSAEGLSKSSVACGKASNGTSLDQIKGVGLEESLGNFMIQVFSLTYGI